MKEQEEEPIIERRNDIIDFDELLVEDAGKKSSVIESLDKSEPKSEIKSKSMISRLKL